MNYELDEALKIQEALKPLGYRVVGFYQTRRCKTLQLLFFGVDESPTSLHSAVIDKVSEVSGIKNTNDTFHGI